MLILLLPLLPWFLCHWAYSADPQCPVAFCRSGVGVGGFGEMAMLVDNMTLFKMVRNKAKCEELQKDLSKLYFHAINMLHLSYFSDSSAVEVVGNATLDGQLTHTLEGHNEQFNVSQLLPLEPSQLWNQRKSNLLLYLQQFQDMVKVTARERNVAYPFHVQCSQGCLIFHNGSSHSFYDIALNGIAFLKFYTANTTWMPLETSSVARYASSQLNTYDETTKSLQFFLQDTCVKFVMEHSDVNQLLTGKHQGRSHTPLVLGIIVGAFALLGLAVCIFLCTGGKR